MKKRLAEGRKVSTVSLAVNGALAVVKLAAGISGNSYALIADAIESLGDIVSSAVVWGGLVMAGKPADRDHPYGHGKAEPLAALVVAGLLGFSAVVIAVQAVNEIITPHHAPAPYTLFVLLAVVAIKESMYRYEAHAGQRIGSTAVQVDAWHHRSDALTSAAAAVGIAVAVWGGGGYEAADDWAALLACLVIMFNGVRFAKTAVLELMDTTPNTHLADELTKAALHVPGALGVEKLLIRKMGPALYVDLHLEVDPELPVRDAHRIAHEVKDVMTHRWPEVADVLIHIEPHVATTASQDNSRLA